MRKLILIMVVITPIIIKANPIMIGASISELYFDESGDWTIEIDNKYNVVNYLEHFEIECKSGSATIEYFDSADFIVIKNINLSNSISISKDSDLIKLYSYIGGDYIIDSIAIGKYPGSYLHNIKNGQSVARLYEYGSFFKDKTPTIGFENDLNGAVNGKIYGHFYDFNDVLIMNKYFFINEGYCTPILQEQGYPGDIEINNEGFYCAEITSRSYEIYELRIYDNSSNSILMHFNQISFDLNENDSINIDFRRNLTSVEEVVKNKILLSNYPNPARDHTYLILDLNGLKLTSMLITVYSTNGEIIKSFKPVSSVFLWNCSELVQGTYIYTLSIDNNIVGANRLQIVK